MLVHENAAVLFLGTFIVASLVVLLIFWVLDQLRKK